MLVNSKPTHGTTPFNALSVGECFYPEGEDDIELKIEADADLIVGRGYYTKKENVPEGAGMSVRLRDGTTWCYAPDDPIIPVNAHVEED